MIISRAPFRVSFVGGGTDFKKYFEQSYGNVISTTIDKSIYVTVNKKFDGKLFLRYSEKELVNHVDELKHDMVKAVLKMFKIESGIEIAIMSDIPAKGSGLGSSSALASALIQAIAKYQGNDIYQDELAKSTCKLEINKMKKPIGMQDQYAICYGGLNKIHFDYGFIQVAKINNGYYKRMVDWLEKISMLFYIESDRKSEKILNDHKKNIAKHKNLLDRQRFLICDMIDWLNSQQLDAKIGKTISESWEIKKKITPSATNEAIDKYILKALHAAPAERKFVELAGVDLCL